MPPLLAAALADALLLAHAAFVLFVVAGAALLPRWPWLARVHLPAVAWGVAVELTGWICPLTPLENRLREAAGRSAYAGDFIGHWVQALLYPAGLTRSMQWALGLAALAINLGAYAWLWRRSRRRRAVR